MGASQKINGPYGHDNHLEPGNDKPCGVVWGGRERATAVSSGSRIH